MVILRLKITFTWLVMIISRHHMKKKPVVSAGYQISSSQEQFRQTKSQLLNQFSCWTWVWPSFGSSCFEKKTLDKYFIGSLLVYGPNISVCRYPKTPWDSNAHCLNWKIKESKFREDSWVAMKYFLAHETIQCTTGLF